MGEQDRRIAEAVEKEETHLRRFIRRHLPGPEDVEDILQDVFVELVEAYRLFKPIDNVGAWLFRVARNRITDLFRKKRPESLEAFLLKTGAEERFRLDELLPSPEGGPDAAYARAVLVEELADALEELPEEQRDIFLAHEVEGRSFKDLAAETGLNINTLLSRKHYAVLHLRQRLQNIYDEFKERRG